MCIGRCIDSFTMWFGMGANVGVGGLEGVVAGGMSAAVSGEDCWVLSTDAQSVMSNVGCCLGCCSSPRPRGA